MTREEKEEELFELLMDDPHGIEDIISTLSIKELDKALMEYGHTKESLEKDLE